MVPTSSPQDWYRRRRSPEMHKLVLLSGWMRRDGDVGASYRERAPTRASSLRTARSTLSQVRVIAPRGIGGKQRPEIFGPCSCETDSSTRSPRCAT